MEIAMSENTTTMEDFLKAIDEVRANEIERKFFEDVLNEVEQIPTLVAAIAFIICRLATKEANDGVEERDPIGFLGMMGALVLETKVTKYSLN
jgi:hypothetical protein